MFMSGFVHILKNLVRLIYLFHVKRQTLSDGDIHSLNLLTFMSGINSFSAELSAKKFVTLIYPFVKTLWIHIS